MSELPGMWEEADFTGGWTDCGQWPDDISRDAMRADVAAKYPLDFSDVINAIDEFTD